jgi:hypothetical protein
MLNTSSLSVLKHLKTQFQNRIGPQKLFLKLPCSNTIFRENLILVYERTSILVQLEVVLSPGAEISAGLEVRSGI